MGYLLYVQGMKYYPPFSLKIIWVPIVMIIFPLLEGFEKF